MGLFRAKFLLESLANLQVNLRQKGSDLFVFIGKPEDILPKLAQSLQANALFYSKDFASEEIQDENAVVKALKPFNLWVEGFWCNTLIHPHDLPFSAAQLPDIFTEFRKAVEKKHLPVKNSFPAPLSLALPPNAQALQNLPLPDLSALGFENTPESTFWEGGETAALAQLDSYFWQKDLLKSYKETRNGLLGFDYSSKFSAWLSLGCISPRYIYEEVRRYEQQRVSNDSTYWLIFELLWRDYFKFVMQKYGRLLFSKGGIRQTTPAFLPPHDEQKLLQRWINGETGVNFIDANMLEIKHTGFMSNRGRQNVASFLVKDLRVDWQLGAAYFEQQLLDYDVCSNWGNWCYVAGVGNDPRENRYFNTAKQAQTYDPQGEYVRHWLSIKKQ
jgi:deoxyribodipyrimidine photo-lyase